MFSLSVLMMMAATLLHFSAWPMTQSWVQSLCCYLFLPWILPRCLRQTSRTRSCSDYACHMFVRIPLTFT